MTLDPVTVIEACYRSSVSDADWLEGVLESLLPLDRGLGIFGRIHGFPQGLPKTTDTAVAVGARSAAWADHLTDTERLATRDCLTRFYWPHPPVRTVRQVAGSQGAAANGLLTVALRLLGADDALEMLAAGPEGRVAGIDIPFAGRARFPARTLHQLTLVSAHLASALRLRARLAGALPAPDGATTPAVLEPSGKLGNAEGPRLERGARNRLAEVVRRVDRTRGGLRRTSPEEAVGLWAALVDGTWTMVDHLQSGGRRLVLARRNGPFVEAPFALSPRERQVLAYAALGHSDKYIGYLLGLTAGTVVGHLRGARHKLGLKTRRDLIAFTPIRSALEQACGSCLPRPEPPRLHDLEVGSARR